MFKYILTLIFCCFLHIGFAQSKAEKQVAEAVENLRLAMIDPTQENLSALISNELSYGHSGGKIEDKAAFMEALLSKKSDFVSIELKEQTIQIVGNVALVRHKLYADIYDNSIANSIKLNILLVWQKQKGSWKLLARQAAKIM